MHSTGRPTVVVGVSGSSASVAALRWAAAEAARRGARLVAVRAWQHASRAYYAVPAGRRDAEHQHQAVTWELASTLRAAFAGGLPASLYTEVIEGLPERVLVDRSAGADMLVLGSAPSPYLSGRSVGPVIRSCLSRAHCPVVVIGPEGLGEELHAAAPAGESTTADQDGNGFRRARPVLGLATTSALLSHPAATDH